jgi:DNA-binding NtrC family response regulator
VLVPLRAVPPPELLSLLDQEPTPAILLSRDYTIVATNAAYRAHYRRPVELGVSRCYAVSHGYDSPCDANGEDCPLRAAVATRRPSRVFHVHQGPDGPEHVDVELRPILDGAGEVRWFIERVHVLQEASAHADGTFIGRSPSFARAVELLHRAAPSDVPVLLLGESGTGKELAAHALHLASGRARGPFVPVECTGLGEHLFESELFGHAKGAFTGADREHAGLVEAARGGTLFLDEIGDVPLALQVKLLRLLETNTFRRVGETERRTADFRLVLATHRPLAQMVADGQFRQDLYFRINAFPVQLPPLRERTEDIPLLLEAILRAEARRGRPRKRPSPSVIAALQRHPFPGNVRELRNLVERTLLLADGDTIELEHLPPEVLHAAPASGAAGGGLGPLSDLPRAHAPAAHVADIRPLAEVERDYVRWAAQQFAGDRRTLARALGLSERTLYRKLGQAIGQGEGEREPPPAQPPARGQGQPATAPPTSAAITRGLPSRRPRPTRTRGSR